jgi:hypothetical protein
VRTDTGSCILGLLLIWLVKTSSHVCWAFLEVFYTVSDRIITGMRPLWFLLAVELL